MSIRDVVVEYETRRPEREVYQAALAIYERLSDSQRRLAALDALRGIIMQVRREAVQEIERAAATPTPSPAIAVTKPSGPAHWSSRGSERHSGYVKDCDECSLWLRERPSRVAAKLAAKTEAERLERKRREATLAFRRDLLVKAEKFGVKPPVYWDVPSQDWSPAGPENDDVRWGWLYTEVSFHEMREEARREGRLQLTRELLSADFEAGGGRRVTWGQARRADHEYQVQTRLASATGNIATAWRHELAIKMLDEYAVESLDQIAVAA